jgi:predicted transcriptional regulator
MELVFTTIALFMVILAASYIFHQRIKIAQTEYEESKSTVRNITLGFTRQVKKMETDLGRIEREANSARYMADQALKAIQGGSDVALKGLEKVKGLSERMNTIEKSIQDMRTDLTKLATQPRLAPAATRVDAPIPVQGEDIFQQLTETEMEVLEMIVDLGEGTVPEIREKIDRTREHTARLLKKLYDRGFIDRNTSSMPYRYSIRKEIRDLILELKKQAPIGL